MQALPWRVRAWYYVCSQVQSCPKLRRVVCCLSTQRRLSRRLHDARATVLVRGRLLATACVLTAMSFSPANYQVEYSGLLVSELNR